MVSAYEREKALNIKRNTELLKSLGLDKPLFEPKEKKAVQALKKRKAPIENGNNEEPIVGKAPKLDLPITDTGVRRSSRNIHKKAIANELQYPERSKYSSGLGQVSLLAPKGLNREYDPKTYGSIPGVEVGTWWDSREACSQDSIHAPWVAGIASGPYGAYSVALSGGYEDDVDLGYAFTYTGCGGRDLKGTKTAPKNLRTAPQSSDQTFENRLNQALKRSAETRKPVRVIRGYKLDSKYAPSEGYRYDGLYIVEKAWMEKGLSEKGYLVCKYAFKRLPEQPPLSVKILEQTEEPEEPGYASPAGSAGDKIDQ